MLQVVLEDGLRGDMVREELTKEIANCTEGEIAVMRKALKAAREP
jgi:hypothetical protein